MEYETEYEYETGYSTRDSRYPGKGVKQFEKFVRAPVGSEPCPNTGLRHTQFYQMFAKNPNVRQVVTNKGQSSSRGTRLFWLDDIMGLLLENTEEEKQEETNKEYSYLYVLPGAYAAEVNFEDVCDERFLAGFVFPKNFVYASHVTNIFKAVAWVYHAAWIVTGEVVSSRVDIPRYGIYFTYKGCNKGWYVLEKPTDMDNFMPFYLFRTKHDAVNTANLLNEWMNKYPKFEEKINKILSDPDNPSLQRASEDQRSDFRKDLEDRLQKMQRAMDEE